MDEQDLTSAKAKAIYKEIQDRVQEKYGFYVTNLSIAQVKQKHGKVERENYNKTKFAESLKTLQYAVNNMAQVRFKFNRYNADHELVPTSEYIHELSPYHLVVYHDNYYCIGLKKGDTRVWHYRVDLMSDVEIVLDEEGKIVPVRITDFEGLPIFNAAWNPEKYMAEHLNMAYDKPRDIRIKIKDTDYTIIHDWFGDHYEKVDEVTGADDDGNESRYDIVKVRTSPSMIVHWAMQYGNRVEIMDEEIRKRIIDESRKVVALYEAMYREISELY